MDAGSNPPPYSTTIQSISYVRYYSGEIGTPVRIEIVISDPDYIPANFVAVTGNIEIRLYN